MQPAFLPYRAQAIRHSPHDCECAGIVPSTPGPTGRPSKAVHPGMPFRWHGSSRRQQAGSSERGLASSSGLIRGKPMNQPSHIEVMGHRRVLASDGAQREEQATIKHKHNGRRSNSPYHTLMLYTRGRRRKSVVGNGSCQNPGLSPKQGAAQSLKDLAYLCSKRVGVVWCC
jgi:hypothetical protein